MTENTPRTHDDSQDLGFRAAIGDQPDDTAGHVSSFDYEAGETPIEGGRRRLPVTGDEDDTEGHFHQRTVMADEDGPDLGDAAR